MEKGQSLPNLGRFRFSSMEVLATSPSTMETTANTSAKRSEFGAGVDSAERVELDRHPVKSIASLEDQGTLQTRRFEYSSKLHHCTVGEPSAVKTPELTVTLTPFRTILYSPLCKI
jgi:hypothetical protein